jgi:phage gp46-like protein
MTDIALRFDPATLSFDIALAGADLATDDGLETAVIISLFTDRRADPDDVIPDGTGDRRGWWADAWPTVDGDFIGSRLWLLAREKELPVVARRAEEYAEEALAWLLAEGVARAVRVTAEQVRRGVLGLTIVIERPDGTAWERVWDYQLRGA